MRAPRPLRGLLAGVVCALAAGGPVRAADEADRLYGNREVLADAARAADIWSARASTDFDAAWKLARACYWLSTHGPDAARRAWLDRGVAAGETATRLADSRPEGHFWLAADMGRLAESYGLVQALKYRGRIKRELERAIAIDPGWEGGSAEAALGQWYFEVPRLFGGSSTKAEEYLRRALAYDSENTAALTYLADVLWAAGRRTEARALLERVIAAPVDPEWAPEELEFKQRAAARLAR